MPQVVTHISEAFSFDELSDSAKERARDWYRQSIDEIDFECVTDDFVTICDIIGIDLDDHEVQLMGGGKRRDPNIYYSVGYCQSDYAAFEGRYDYKATAPVCIKDHAPQDEELHRIVDQLTILQIQQGFGLSATIKYSDYRGFHVEVYDRRNEDRDVSEAEDAIRELVKDLARWLYKQLRDQSDYLHSDEQVDESINANEYMFDEEGNRHDYA
jgi:hypothetical protein